VQVAKVRTEKLRHEAAKASRHQVKLTLQPMLLLNKAENDAQNGHQAGGALAASNQARCYKWYKDSTSAYRERPSTAKET
jgi:hypothetical protein